MMELRLVFRYFYLTDAAPRAACQPTHIVSNLEKVGGQGFQRSVKSHHAVQAGKGMKLVLRGYKPASRKLADSFCNLFAKLEVGV